MAGIEADECEEAVAFSSNDVTEEEGRAGEAKLRQQLLLLYDHVVSSRRRRSSRAYNYIGDYYKSGRWQQLLLQAISSLLVVVYVCAGVGYVGLKSVLYARHMREVALGAPWLLVLLACECAYLVGALMAALVDFLPPPSCRPDLTLRYNHVHHSHSDPPELQPPDHRILHLHAQVRDAPSASHAPTDSTHSQDTSTPLTNDCNCDHHSYHGTSHTNNTHANHIPKGFHHHYITDDHLKVSPSDTAYDHFPTVDILIPCCHEPIDIPQESIEAALCMQYPRNRFKVLVLDDGADEELRAFCRALQEREGHRLVYLCRPKELDGPPRHFKCGNLNYGLQNSKAEYVVVMDADMILHPTFLLKLLPHVIDSPNIAFVQIPQSFYNLPLGDPLNDTCVFSYERVMVRQDNMGSASCIGTGAIFRRTCLDKIKGFQYQSITEDTLTAYTLFNKGYRSVYLSTQKLQIGLAPWTLEGHVKQRQRWTRGSFQQFASTWKTMLGKKSQLSWFLKVCYIWNTYYYCLSIVNVVFLSVTLGALAFGVDMTIGDSYDNLCLLVLLALSLVSWRLAWYVESVNLTNPILNRNREESQFWWMTPFIFKVVMQSIFMYKSTFTFVPTSMVETNIMLQDESVHLWSQLKNLRVHLIYIVVALVVVFMRACYTTFRYLEGHFINIFPNIGLSFFTLTVCVHVLVPIIYVSSQTHHKPIHRKSFLKYDCDGRPQCERGLCTPKWHWSIVIYESMSISNLAFWITILFVTTSKIAIIQMDQWKDGMIN